MKTKKSQLYISITKVAHLEEAKQLPNGLESTLSKSRNKEISFLLFWNVVLFRIKHIFAFKQSNLTLDSPLPNID